jgi:hypothetical protein
VWRIQVIETPDKGLGYLHKEYKEIGVHEAASVWQTCMCRSCQDVRELRHYEKGTGYRHKDEKY